MKAKAAAIIEQSERERRHLAREWQREQAKRKTSTPRPATFTYKPFEGLAEILMVKEDK